MNEQNTKKLFRDFPLLYSGRTESIQTNLMSFGFECGDGWFNLIYDLSENLEELILKFTKEYPDTEPPKAIQVKEKFGGLRFYMTTGTDEMYDILDEAEEMSYTICEFCGEPGKLRPGGWLYTLCDECCIEQWGEIRENKNDN